MNHIYSTRTRVTRAPVQILRLMLILHHYETGKVYGKQYRKVSPLLENFLQEPTFRMSTFAYTLHKEIREELQLIP